MTPANTKYKAIGFVFLNGRPPIQDPEQYHDFIDKIWSPEELNLGLKVGIFAPGTILQGNKDTVVVINLDSQDVKPEPNQPKQTLVNISRIIGTKPEPRTIQVKPVCPGCGMTFDLTPTIDWVHRQNLTNIQEVM